MVAAIHHDNRRIRERTRLSWFGCRPNFLGMAIDAPGKNSDVGERLSGDPRERLPRAPAGHTETADDSLGHFASRSIVFRAGCIAGYDHELRASIPSPRRLVVPAIERPLLAITDRMETCGRQAEPSDVCHYRVGPTSS